MTNETSAIPADQNPIPFGMRLKNAREAMGMELKDAAEQLRLNERFIVMMEKDRYPVDLPFTFIRGYIKAYSKLLEIPEQEVKKAIEPMKQKQPAVQHISQSLTKPIPMTSSNYFMQLLTYAIVLTLFGLVAVWWYTHTNQPGKLLNRTSAHPFPENFNSTMFVQPTITHPHTSINQLSDQSHIVEPSNHQNPLATSTSPVPATTNTAPPPKIENPPKAVEKTPPRVENKRGIELPSPLGNNIAQSRGKPTKDIEPAVEEEDYADDL